MSQYELDSVVSSPVGPTTFLDFSSNGRFLVVGGQDPTSLHVLDRLAGFHPMVSFVTPAEPTALVWETPKTFYAGFRDGRFVHYRIDLGENRLVAGATNNFFHGSFPITAMALDAESETLVLSVGPEIFMFRRILATSTSIPMDWERQADTYLRPIPFHCQHLKPLQIQERSWNPSPPVPKINILYIQQLAYHHILSSEHRVRHTSTSYFGIRPHQFAIRSITLEFNGGSHLCTSLQMSGV